MFRKLLWLIVFVWAAWLVRRLFVRPAAGAGATRSADPAQAGGRMVRDRVCNTFLPEAKALRLDTDGEARFFCSERCRDRFLTERSATPRAS